MNEAHTASWFHESSFDLRSPLARTASEVWRVLASPIEMRPAAQVDRATRLYNQHGFESRGNLMLTACQQAGRDLAVIVFDFHDLLEARAIYGNKVAREATTRVVRKLCTLAGPNGLVARTGQVEFTVVLPGADFARGLARVEKVLGPNMSVECDPRYGEMVMVPSLLIGNADGNTACIEDVQYGLRAELARKRANEERKHSQMRRQRERHARAHGLPELIARAA